MSQAGSAYCVRVLQVSVHFGLSNLKLMTFKDISHMHKSYTWCVVPPNVPALPLQLQLPILHGHVTLGLRQYSLPVSGAGWNCLG